MVLVEEDYGKNASELASKAERQGKERTMAGRKTKEEKCPTFTVQIQIMIHHGYITPKCTVAVQFVSFLGC